MATVTTIQTRVDTAANWASANPVPGAGEMCIEFDSLTAPTIVKIKSGNGTIAYNSLPYSASAVVAATTTVSGIVELATALETTTGTDTVRAVTPAGLQAVVTAITATRPAWVYYNTSTNLWPAVTDPNPVVWVSEVIGVTAPPLGARPGRIQRDLVFIPSAQTP